MASNYDPGNELRRAVIRLQVRVLTLVSAVLGGSLVFLMTVWLLLRGGPRVGTHLALLHHYFIGYSVTWPGSVIGLAYGALVGGITGWAVGKIYNWIVDLRDRTPTKH